MSKQFRCTECFDSVENEIQRSSPHFMRHYDNVRCSGAYAIDPGFFARQTLAPLIASCKTEIASLEKKIRKSESTLKSLKLELRPSTSPLNPLNWFRVESKIARKKLSVMSLEVVSINSDRQEKINYLTRELDGLSADFARKISLSKEIDARSYEADRKFNEWLTSDLTQHRVNSNAKWTDLQLELDSADFIVPLRCRNCGEDNLRVETRNASNSKVFVLQKHSSSSCRNSEQPLRRGDLIAIKETLPSTVRRNSEFPRTGSHVIDQVYGVLDDEAIDIVKKREKGPKDYGQ